MSKKTEMKTEFKKQAKEYDRRGDVVLRNQAAQNWRELASESEAKTAPAYLTWIGRKS